MRWRLLLVALLVVGSSVFAGIGALAGPAQPEATCRLPGAVGCLDDSTCTPFGALCDVLAGACVCPSTDLGTDAGGADAGASDAGASDGGSAPPPPAASGATGPLVGGGMAGPLKSGGCSFVPGRSEKRAPGSRSP